METSQNQYCSSVDEPSITAYNNAASEKTGSPSEGSSVNIISETRPEDILKNLKNVYIYRQDVVINKTKDRIGIVTEVAGDTDSDSDISDDADEDDEEDEEEEEEEDDEEDEEEDGEAKTSEDNNVANNGKTEEIVDGNKDDDSYKCQPLPADKVRVLWMDDSETMESMNDVTVVDRAFLHGNYVASASDPTGQVGVVVDVNISVDLLTHDGSVLKDVSSRVLKRVRDFTVGDYVVFGPWLGRIDDVQDNVTVMFDDGSMCKVKSADPLRLKPVGKNTLDDGHFPYYPGQRVKASSSSVLKNCRWISGLWKANRLEGTISEVTTGSVFIYWIVSAGYGPDASTAPAEEQSPKNLKLLSCFAHANWQLGDWCLLPSEVSSIPLDNELSKLGLHDAPKDLTDTAEHVTDLVISEGSNRRTESLGTEDEALSDGNENIENGAYVGNSSCSSSSSTQKAPIHETWPLHRKRIRKLVVKKEKKSRKKEEKFDRALLIINTKTKVDVIWQDGTTEPGRNSTTLIPIDSPGDHEFVAEQYVVEKGSDECDDASEVKRVGVIKSVNARERTACVRWLKPVAMPEDPREFDKEEVVSVYELEGHPDYDYCYGDVVVRLSPVVDPPLTSLEQSNTPTCPNEVKNDKERHPGFKKVDGASTDDSSAEFSSLPWVGNITGLRNGDIEVTWADGMISLVGPQAIYVVGRDGDESIAGGSDINGDAASWETVDDDEKEILENAKEELERSSDTEIVTEGSTANVAENSGRNGALAFPLAALGFVTRIASGIFSTRKRNEDSSSGDSRSDDEVHSHELTVRSDPGHESCSQKSDGTESIGTLTSKIRDLEHIVVDTTELQELETFRNSKLVKANGLSDQCNVEGSSFKRFDITNDPFDHYFLGADGQNNAGRKWLKKVQQDWNILQNNLPDGIYARVYEDRMDLLRAVIVGAYGTPYQDGLFFFDFHLPPEYPDVPPSAYYHSGGWRVNPNLYEEGKVCLSLLNTWTGRGNEVWDPSSSSILQVLVSLQGLVLNSKPYFNEAGYDKQIGTAEGEKNSLSYNENTFLLNCKTMMYLLRKPPQDFEALVREHFRRRGYYILKACDAYMKGYLIGSLTKDAIISSNSSADSNSVGFKLMLAKIVPKLFVALNEVGADCQDFKHLKEL